MEGDDACVVESEIHEIQQQRACCASLDHAMEEVSRIERWIRHHNHLAKACLGSESQLRYLENRRCTEKAAILHGGGLGGGKSPWLALEAHQAPVMS